MSRRFTCAVVTAILLVPPVPPCLSQTAPSAPSEAVPLTRERMVQFLASARIVADKDIPVGVTHPVRLTLDDGQMRHDAAFSTVDERLPIWKGKNNTTELDFVDSYQYTLAAYGVAGIVGLADMMPAMVERRWNQLKGVLTWWVDDAFDEQHRLKKGLRPPDPQAWNDQLHRMKVFAQLVADTDRNVGNILIGPDWKLWMIDFTRAFRRTHQLVNVNDLQRCDRQLLERLRALTKAEIAEKTRPYIGGAEIDALLARRDLIVARFDQLVAERGEARVLDQPRGFARRMTMRVLMAGLTVGVLLAGAANIRAQDGTPGANTFSGIKLVDMKARTPEQAVTVSVGKEHVRVIDPVAKKDIKTFAYAGLTVTHTLSNTPPASAGAPESAQTQRGEAPTYMGKAERNWLTLKAEGEVATLRVSEHVYAQLKSALESHQVKIEDAK